MHLLRTGAWSAAVAALLASGCAGPAAPDDDDDAADDDAADDDVADDDDADDDAADDDADDDDAADDDSAALNTPPTAPGVTVEPAAPTDEDALVCSVATPSEDADGDAVSYAYSWAVDGAEAGIVADTVGPERTAVGEAWTCRVTPHDGIDAGAPGEAEVVIASAADLAPDFDLEDLNPSSPRFGDVVSPRDYLGMVSGWYFAHAT
ncbi:hypothetical protein L6R50_25795 [Myxococcota bacterium]|nr:hypothetical protein [Myxococcota bacterium]